MRVLIAGAGAIGSFVGGRLALAGHTVGLLGRSAYVARVRTFGLELVEAESRHTIQGVQAHTHADVLCQALGGVDLAIVTTKVHDTRPICRDLKMTLGNDATIMILQNGVGGEEIAAEEFAPRRLVSGVITHVVTAEAPGYYRVRGAKGGIGLAPVTAQRNVDRWNKMLRIAGITCRTYDDYRRPKWSKLLLNMLGNAVPAILDMAPEHVFAHRELYALEMAAFREALRVMAAQGVRPVKLPGYPVPAIARLLLLPHRLTRKLMIKRIAGGRAGKKPSLQIDIERGRSRSEVVYLNGAVANAGADLGLACPANAAITAALDDILTNKVLREHYARRPHALLAHCRSKGYGAKN